MFFGMTNTMKLVRISLRISKGVKILYGRQLWLKKSFSVLGERPNSQIEKFNWHPYTLRLQCPSYSKFSQLSYVSGRVMNIDAKMRYMALKKVCFNFFLKRYFIHLPKDILLLLAQKAMKQYKWYFPRKLLCQGLRNYKIGKSTVMLVRTTALI